MMPTGGVDVDNVDQWIKAGAVAVGAPPLPTKGAKTGDYAAITATAKESIKRIKEARGRRPWLPRHKKPRRRACRTRPPVHAGGGMI